MFQYTNLLFWVMVAKIPTVRSLFLCFVFEYLHLGISSHRLVEMGKQRCPLPIRFVILVHVVDAVTDLRIEKRAGGACTRTIMILRDGVTFIEAGKQNRNQIAKRAMETEPR